MWPMALILDSVDIIYIHIYVYILSEIGHSIFLHVRILNVHCKVSLHFYVNIVNRD